MCYYYSKCPQCWVPYCLLRIILILGHPSLFLGGWGEWRKNSEQFVLQSPAWFPNHSSHTRLFHNHIFKRTYASTSSSQQKMTFALSAWGVLWAVSVSLKLKLLLIDCYWYQWNRFLTMHCDRLSYWSCLKHTTQFLSFVIYDKNVKMKPLKVRAKLQIHELLWLRAAELQRKNDNRMKERSAKPDQRSEWRSLERPI